MKILIVSTSDLRGGAAIAANRLLQGLNVIDDTTAKMLVLEKLSSDSNVIEVGNTMQKKWGFYSERGIIFLKNKLSRKNLFDVSIASNGVSITKTEEFKEADVIHLHWINQGMLSLDEIERILLSGKKVVWTMHDMWAFTGICHYAGRCSHYSQECGMCPYLQSQAINDLSNSIFIKKQNIYSKGHITFVACSNWLKELAAKSSLTSNHSLSEIPNPIDTSIYYPKDKYSIRENMNLPKNKKIVLFAAMRVSDRRKGIDYLLEASNILAKQNSDIMFLIVGSDGDDISSQLILPSLNIGYVKSDDMVDIYNAVDLFVTPSLQDNLPNTIMEAMSCGTPCVGFNIGGIPEMIQHLSTGYVANYKDSEDLANGIKWVLNDADSETLSSNSREYVMKNYSQEKVVNRYLELYQSL